MPRCLSCKEKFTAKHFNQKHCMDKDECIKAFTTYAKQLREREKKRTDKEEKQSWTKEKKERKEAILTYSEWLEIFQKVFNTYIKLRDGKNCISCGTQKETTQYAAGHFFSVGGFPNVRFDEDNVHSQCNKYCNMHLSANIIEYRPKLIEKIGIERFEALELRARTSTLKLSIPEIKEKIQEYKEKIKQLNLKQ